MMKLLAISGSLRCHSSNSALLRAAFHYVPRHIETTLYAGLGSLPLFNPDREQNILPSVEDFRQQLQDSQGILIASPEYAHGVTGVIKNALDWITGSGELVNKPIALFNASSRATIAYASLKETLSVMMGQIIPEASITIPLPSNTVAEADIIADAKLADMLETAMQAFMRAIQESKSSAHLDNC